MVGLIFVFFKASSPKRGRKNNQPPFDSPLIPDWYWVGSGGSSNKEYPNEEQWQGEFKSRKEFRKHLDAYYSLLKEKGFIERYKIRYSYSP